jgi:hypothetical protein
VPAWRWDRIVLGIHTSDSASGGWVDLWCNRSRQAFSNGTTRFTGRTWNTYNDPKWGVYDRDTPGHAATNRIDAPKVGTTYDDVVR